MLVMPGRVTMLGISRWAGKGGSYRTGQRLFSQALPWAMLCWVFFRQHVYRPEEVYLLAGDEVVVTKAGKHPYGLDRFFSSLYGKPIPGLAFLAFSRVSVQARRAFPVRVEQVVRSEAAKAASKAKAAAKQQKPSTPLRRPGRPKGSRSTPPAAVPLTPEVSRITAMLDALLKLIARRHPIDLLGARRTLRPPQRPRYGAAAPPPPDFQASVRCGVVLPLRRSLCWSGAPS
jgi:putative transposase